MIYINRNVDSHSNNWFVSYMTYTRLQSMQSRARDSKRRTDIYLLANALNMYYGDNGDYPMSTCNVAWCHPCGVVGCKPWAEYVKLSWWFQTALVPAYMSSPVVDPLENRYYTYYYHVPGDITYIQNTCNLYNGNMGKIRSIVQVSYVPETPQDIDLTFTCAWWKAWSSIHASARGIENERKNWGRWVWLANWEKYYYAVVAEAIK